MYHAIKRRLSKIFAPHTLVIMPRNSAQTYRIHISIASFFFFTLLWTAIVGIVVFYLKGLELGIPETTLKPLKKSQAMTQPPKLQPSIESALIQDAQLETLLTQSPQSQLLPQPSQALTPAQWHLLKPNEQKNNIITKDPYVQNVDYLNCKIEELQDTLTLLKQSEKELEVFLCYDSKEEILSNVDLTDPVSIELDIVRQEVQATVKKVPEIQAFLNVERDEGTVKPFGWPVKGRIVASYGRKINKETGKWEFNPAIQIGKLGNNATVKSAALGIVGYSGFREKIGNLIVIEHGQGYQTVYANTKTNNVKVGQMVNQGDTIAEMGDSNDKDNYLYYAIWKEGKPENPVFFLQKNIINCQDTAVKQTKSKKKTKSRGKR
jgi:murein DD-endopeptidase MepM/ murein hydrolase activator NlpD